MSETQWQTWHTSQRVCFLLRGKIFPSCFFDSCHRCVTTQCSTLAHRATNLSTSLFHESHNQPLLGFFLHASLTAYFTLGDAHSGDCAWDGTSEMPVHILRQALHGKSLPFSGYWDSSSTRAPHLTELWRNRLYCTLLYVLSVFFLVQQRTLSHICWWGVNVCRCECQWV